MYFVSVAISQANDNSVETKHSSNPPISKITYSSSGGRGGKYETLNISSAFVIYVQGHGGAEKTIKEKTVKDFWNRLTKTINLKDFDKIKSNPGHALYDGIDITISIERGKEKHTIVNGNEDASNYKKIRPFTYILEKKLSQLRKRITW